MRNWTPNNCILLLKKKNKKAFWTIKVVNLHLNVWVVVGWLLSLLVIKYYSPTIIKSCEEPFFAGYSSALYFGDWWVVLSSKLYLASRPFLPESEYFVSSRKDNSLIYWSTLRNRNTSTSICINRISETTNGLRLIDWPSILVLNYKWIFPPFDALAKYF